MAKNGMLPLDIVLDILQLLCRLQWTYSQQWNLSVSEVPVMMQYPGPQRWSDVDLDHAC
jgi:hypothetical protein